MGQFFDSTLCSEKNNHLHYFSQPYLVWGLYGRAYATVLRLSVVDCLYGMYCG